jgi:ABC-2 type transport system ATP-binding protein
VTKLYGATVAVNGLSLEVQPGEVVGLLGPNGAGKSTTLYMLAGLVRPSTGTISIFGRDRQKHFLDIAARMGVLVERPAFQEHLNLRRNLLYHGKLTGKAVNVDRILDLVGLLDMAHKKVGSLSLGMRQRLGLAQAMLTEPELLLLDEPSTGLDVESTQEVLQLLRRLADDAGVTILVSSHMMHEVEVLCDRVAIMNEGRLVACERIETLVSFDQSQVEVILDGAEGAARKLNEQPWVEKTEVKTGRLLVRLNGADVHQLIAFLMNAGYHLSGIIPKRRTLRDYFLKVLNQ